MVNKLYKIVLRTEDTDITRNTLNFKNGKELAAKSNCDIECIPQQEYQS
jgi:hypothetical protein